MAEEAILRQILKTLQEINEKLDRAPANSDDEDGTVKPLDAVALLELPDHLRRTAMALHELGRATAERVCEKTGNSRSIESAYLNQLVRSGYVRKERGKGEAENPKKVYFFV